MMALIYWHKENGLFWMRIPWGGICLSRRPLSFSERNGYAAFLPLIFGWRIFLLRRYDF